MGRECKATLRFDGRIHEGTAILESEEVLFRGGPTVKVRFAEVRRVEASGGWLDLETARGMFAFQLGEQAASWAEKIKNPKALIEKLGVDATKKVVVFGTLDPDLRAELVESGAAIAKTTRSKQQHVAFLPVTKRKDLEKLDAARAAIREDGAIWIVYPKGREDPSERDVLTAGRTRELTDDKVAKVTDALTAVRFVIPVAKRTK